jgi:hypothetical protein
VALANCRADSVRLQLFLHAQRTLRAARRVRARWQDLLHGPAVAAREDVMAAGAHERDRKRRDAEFSRVALRARDKAGFIAQRRIACKALGIRTVRQLMGLFPGWTCVRAPRKCSRARSALQRSRATLGSEAPGCAIARDSDPMMTGPMCSCQSSGARLPVAGQEGGALDSDHALSLP